MACRITQGRCLFCWGIVGQSDSVVDRRGRIAARRTRFLKELALEALFAGAAGSGESLPAGQSGASDPGGPGTGRDVYRERLPGTEVAGD